MFICKQQADKEPIDYYFIKIHCCVLQNEGTGEEKSPNRPSQLPECALGARASDA